MAERKPSIHERWALFRFSVVGPLLAAPPGRGDLQAEIRKLSECTWEHPVTGEPVRFGASTIERWYYRARGARTDPVGALRKKVRKDKGSRPAMGRKLQNVLRAQYERHSRWSYQLHYDNLRILIESDPELGPLPSYATVRRFMKACGLIKQRRVTARDTEGARRAERRLQQREVRSFEAEYVFGLLHLDYHHCSRKILMPSGEWVRPVLLGILDDRSRLLCHAQWYLAETSENLVHGLCQAFAKRQLPRALMTDNGSAMVAAETVQGLARLGILHQPILPYSAYQNGKNEFWFSVVESRLMAMLEGCRDLTLAQLNEATQAWSELEYNRTVHSETGQSPLQRALSGPGVGRPCPSAVELRMAFMLEESRAQRKSDGTVSIEGRRFEVPARYRHLERVVVRYARWDLTRVYLVDDHTGTVLDRLLPLDRTANADGRRRALDPETASPLSEPPVSGVAPLLEKLLADYRATGLPPAYLPKDDDLSEPENSR
jgi:putative transposase